MLEPLLGTDRDLSGKFLSGGKNRRTNDRGKSRINKGLAADDNKHAVFLGIAAGLADAIQFAALHCLLGGLVVQNVRSFGVEAIGGGVDPRKVTRVQGGATAIAKIAAENTFDHGRAGRFGAGKAIKLTKHVFGECDRGLLFHTTNILPRRRAGKDISWNGVR